MKLTRNFRLFAAFLLAIISLQLRAAPPATRPAPGAATRPTAQKSSIDIDDEVRERTQMLTRKSIELLKAGKYEEATKTLTEVLELDPEHSTNLYNMACLQAQLGHSNAAMEYLQKSAAAGFTDFIHIEQDPDLVSLRDLKKYKDFLASKAFYQHKAAEMAVVELKRQFGQNYIYEIDDTDKLIFATNTDEQTLEALKKALLRQAHSQWAQLFEHKPDQFITVVVPSLVDYAKIVSMRGVEGFYNHAARTLIAKGLGFVTMHEFTHTLHAADLDPLGQDHPIWLVEGMAVLFEHAEYEGDVLVPKDNVRLYSLQLSGKQNHTIPFARLFTMQQREFVARANLAYGESGSIMLYLYEQKLLRKFYDAVKSNYDKDKTGKVAMELVTGKTLAEVDRDWKIWMLGRRPPPVMTGANGPFIGVAFASANDGLKIETLVPNGPAATAGMKVGDVVVGVGDLDVRDVTAFMPLLSTHKAGDTIVLKVRREKEYLDLPIKLGKRNAVLAAGGAPATRPAAVGR